MKQNQNAHAVAFLQRVAPIILLQDLWAPFKLASAASTRGRIIHVIVFHASPQAHTFRSPRILVLLALLYAFSRDVVECVYHFVASLGGSLEEVKTISIAICLCLILGNLAQIRQVGLVAQYYENETRILGSQLRRRT